MYSGNVIFGPESAAAGGVSVTANCERPARAEARPLADPAGTVPAVAGTVKIRPGPVRRPRPPLRAPLESHISDCPLVNSTFPVAESTAVVAPRSPRRIVTPGPP